MSSSVPASMSPPSSPTPDVPGAKVVVAGPAGPVLSALVRSFQGAGADTVKLIHSAPGKHGRSRPAGGPDDPPSTHVVDLTSPTVAQHLPGASVVVLDCIGPDPDADLDRVPPLRRRELVAMVRSLATAASRESAQRHRDTGMSARLRANPGGFRAEAGLHLIVVTSAWVLATREPHKGTGREDGPARAVRREESTGLQGDLFLVEHALATATDASVRTTVVRPAPLVGPAILDQIVAETLGGPGPEGTRLRPWGARGRGAGATLGPEGRSQAGWPSSAEVGWPEQFCHVDDLASAVLHVAGHSTGPEVSVGSAPGRSRPRHPPGWQGDPAISPWPPVVDTTELETTGWVPEHDDAACRGLVAIRLAAGRAPEPRARDLAAAGIAVTATLAFAAVSARRRRSRGRA